MAEALARALPLLNIRRENSAVVLKPEQETAIPFFMGEKSWQFCQQVLARA